MLEGWKSWVIMSMKHDSSEAKRSLWNTALLFLPTSLYIGCLQKVLPILGEGLQSSVNAFRKYSHGGQKKTYRSWCFSFYYIGSRDWTHFIRFNIKCLYLMTTSLQHLSCFFQDYFVSTTIKKKKKEEDTRTPLQLQLHLHNFMWWKSRICSQGLQTCHTMFSLSDS